MMDGVEDKGGESREKSQNVRNAKTVDIWQIYTSH